MSPPRPLAAVRRGRDCGSGLDSRGLRLGARRRVPQAVPPLVGYLGGGLALYALGATGGELLHEVGHVGVLLLLLTVGLHVRPRNVVRPEVIAVALSFSSTVLGTKALEARNELEAVPGTDRGRYPHTPGPRSHRPPRAGRPGLPVPLGASHLLPGPPGQAPAPAPAGREPPRGVAPALRPPARARRRYPVRGAGPKLRTWGFGSRGASGRAPEGRRAL